MEFPGSLQAKATCVRSRVCLGIGNFPANRIIVYTKDFMKKGVLGLIWALRGCLALWAAEPTSVELKGIVQFPKSGEPAQPPGAQSGGGSPVALIEFQPWPQRTVEEFALLEEGQRQGAVEVIKIDVEAGVVQARVNGESRELLLALPKIPKRAASNATGGSIRLKEATRRETLEIYQQLVGRTLLRSSSVGNGNRITLQLAGPAPSDELANSVEKALDGLVFHPDEDKFTVVGREGDFEKLTPELREFARNLKLAMPSPPGAQGPKGSSGNKPDEDMVPAGVINFWNTDFFQVLQVFQELVNRTLLRPASLTGSGIYLKTQTPLTREDVVYAMCAVLALDGVSFVDLDDKFLFVYPTSEAAKRKGLFARKPPPHADSHGSQTTPRDMGNSWLDTSTVAKVYGELSGQPVELAQDLPQTHFTFREQTPLTTGEKLYALDLLLGWEGMQVVTNKDSTGLRLTRME